jgi:hypothetical protein
VKALEASEDIARILKQAVEERRHTGCVDIHLDCNQGGIRNVKIALTESKVSIFEFSGSRKKDVDTELNIDYVS